MRVLKLIVSALSLFIALPTAIVVVLGFVLSPLQPVARATETRVVLEANDIPQEVAAESAEPVAEAPEESEDAAANENVLAAGESAVDAQAQGADSGPVAQEAHLQEEAVASGAIPAGDASSAGEGVSGEVSPDLAPMSAGGESYEASLPSSAGHYTSDQLFTQGVIDDGSFRYTWYSQRVLPGGGLSIDGRHVSDEGYVVDGSGRIVVASSDLPYGTEVDIPFGSGKGVVLDTGCAPGILDIYTDF